MKKVNGEFVLSKTDIKKAEAHTRAIARKQKGQYSGHIECIFDSSTGEFYYCEHVGFGGYTQETDDLKRIYCATVYEFE